MARMHLARWMAAGLAAAVAGAAWAAAPWSGRVTLVSDGDTLWVRPLAGGVPVKLRVDGIDAPEICQSGGAASRAALERLVADQVLVVQPRRRDDFGRWLARVRVAGADVGAEMVRQGQAWSYRYRDHPGPYAGQEAQARAARRGLFSGPAERPYDFRRRHGPCEHPHGRPSPPGQARP
jgi:endonuclease YncB( thermonuclease family)